MNRKLTNEERAMLEELYKDETLENRGAIRRFIIRNTYEPKFKVGDCVIVSVDHGEYIYGKLIQGVKMKIEEINWWLSDKGEECVQYAGTALEEGTNRDFYIVAEESIHGKHTYRHIDGIAKDNINVFEKKNDIRQSTTIGRSPL